MTAAECAALRPGYNFRCGYGSVSETDVGAALTTTTFSPPRVAAQEEPGGTWRYLNVLCPSAQAVRKSSVRSGWRRVSWVFHMPVITPQG